MGFTNLSPRGHHEVGTAGNSYGLVLTGKPVQPMVILYNDQVWDPILAPHFEDRVFVAFQGHPRRARQSYASMSEGQHPFFEDIP